MSSIEHSISAGYSDEDLIELSLLRGQEVDCLDQAFFPKEKRFEDETLQSLTFKYPEIRLKIITGQYYLAEELSLEIENLAFPRLVYDALRIELRKIILRDDLYSRFLASQRRVREWLEKLTMSELKKGVPFDRRRASKEAMIGHLIEPKLTFHGTQNFMVPSIVRNGFLLPDDLNPETEKDLEIRCGNINGAGIYSSPIAWFSLLYSGEDARPTKPNGFWGIKLIICSTMMGRSAVMYRNGKFEYVVFETAQYFPAMLFTPIGEQTIRLCSRIALKILRIGWSLKPTLRLTTGTSFVIEDISEVDEDEENYRDYQGDRMGFGNGKQFWEWDDPLEGIEQNNEYTEALLSQRGKMKKTAV
ncbi:hypothetical protein B7494_g5377 [Chlorociboria aeruginascens]|nr:hypothetical protein B7494_g5377 [Chlorociboria aeruginascens]